MGHLSVKSKNAITAKGFGGAVNVGLGLTAQRGIRGNMPGGDEYPVDVDVVLLLDGLRYVVDELTIHRREGGVSITGEHLRKIPVQEVVQEVVKGLTWAGVADADGQIQAPVTFGDKEPARLTRKEIKAIVEAGPTDQTLEVVARIYVIAELSGEPPAKSVRETFKVPPSTAGYWIRRAKDRGLLHG